MTVTADYYPRRFPHLASIPADRGAEWCPVLAWSAAEPFDRGAATAGDPLEAYEELGRLIVQCPECLGAQFACTTDLRFMCCDCGNPGNGGKFRPVTLPSEG